MLEKQNTRISIGQQNNTQPKSIKIPHLSNRMFQPNSGNKKNFNQTDFKCPLVERITNYQTPMKQFTTEKEYNPLVSAQLNQPSKANHDTLPVDKTFENVFIEKDSNISNQAEFKKQFILNMIPLDPQLSNLSVYLQKQARQYQQKQLLQNFPLRYNQLLRKEVQLEDMVQTYLRLEKEKNRINLQNDQLRTILQEERIKASEKQKYMGTSLEEINQAKIRQIQSLKTEYQAKISWLEDARAIDNTHIQTITIENKNLFQQIDNLALDIHNRSQENQRLSNIIIQYKVKIETLQEVLQKVKVETRSQIDILQIKQSNNLREIDKLLAVANKLELQKKQLQPLREEVIRLNYYQQEYNRLTQQRTQLLIKSQELQIALSEKSFSLESTTSRLRDIEIKYNESLNQNMLLTIQLDDLKKSHAVVISENVKLVQHINKIQQQLQQEKQITSQINKLREKQRNLQTQNDHYSKSIQQLEYTKEKLIDQNSNLLKQLKLVKQQREKIILAFTQIKNKFEQSNAKKQNLLHNLKNQVKQQMDKQEVQKLTNENQIKLLKQKLEITKTELENEKNTVQKLQADIAEKEKMNINSLEQLKLEKRLATQSQKNSQSAQETIKKLKQTLHEKDQQIKYQQNLLHDTKSTILSLSQSLKQKGAREKQLFDEVLRQKRHLKKQIQQLEFQLKMIKNKQK